MPNYYPEAYEEAYNALSSKSKNAIFEINVPKTPGIYTHSFNQFETSKSAWIILGFPDNPWSNHILIKMPNGQVIAFKTHASIDDIKNACQEYWGLISKYTPAQLSVIKKYSPPPLKEYTPAHKEGINPKFFNALKIWFMLCTFLYAFGISIAWTRRGFKINATDCNRAQ
jgi:hypothetical protein